MPFNESISGFINIRGLSRNWCSFSVDGLVMPSINFDKPHIFCSAFITFPTSTHGQVHPIDLKLHWVLWKQLHIRLQKEERKKRKLNYALTSSSHSEVVHLTSSFSKYHPLAAKHTSILSHPFFKRWFQILPSECVQRSFEFPLDRLGICFIILAV